MLYFFVVLSPLDAKIFQSKMLHFFVKQEIIAKSRPILSSLRQTINDNKLVATFLHHCQT
jgi:hypothetical protein